MDPKVRNIRYKPSNIRPTPKASMISPYNPEENVLEPYLTTTPYPTTTIRPLNISTSNTSISTITKLKRLLGF